MKKKIDKAKVTKVKPAPKSKNSVKSSVEEDKSRTRGLTPFPPGVSGNPAGRPKGKLNYDTRVDMAINALAEIYVAQHNALPKNKGKQIKLEDVDIEGEIFMQHLKKARSGDQKAIDSFLDRRHGKAMQRLELGGIDGNPIQHEHHLAEVDKELEDWEKMWTPSDQK